MAEVCFLVEDLVRFERALNARGIATRRDVAGALVVDCTVQQARDVAAVARIKLRAQWPFAVQLTTPPAGSPPADTTHEEEQP